MSKEEDGSRGPSGAPRVPGCEPHQADPARKVRVANAAEAERLARELADRWWQQNKFRRVVDFSDLECRNDVGGD